MRAWRFREEVSQIRPAVAAMLAEAAQIAASGTGYASYENVFGKLEESWET